MCHSLGADRRRLATAGVTLPEYELVTIARKGTGAHCARHVEIAGVGTIRRRPVLPPIPDGCISVGVSQKVSKIQPACHSQAVRQRIAARWRRRSGTAASWLSSAGPVAGALLNADQGLAVGGSRMYQPVRRLRQSLARLAIDHRIEETTGLAAS